MSWSITCPAPICEYCILLSLGGCLLLIKPARSYSCWKQGQLRKLHTFTVLTATKFTPLFEIEINFLHHVACLPSLACCLLITGTSAP